jgi:NADH-quinone oxidoreductase subunit J
MFTGYYRLPVEHSLSKLILALASAAALQAPLLVYASISSHHMRKVTLSQVTSELLSCRVCLLVIIVAIASVLVEAVALARSEVGKTRAPEEKPGGPA